MPGPSGLDYAGRIGITHWDPKYNFTPRPILEEGADRIWDLGARIIKLELDTSGKIPAEYPFNHAWRDYGSIRELVASPDFTAVLRRPWRWVNFQVAEAQRAVPVTWCDGMSEEESRAEREAFYELARFLLEEYEGSGISFLLDHWEGDNALDRNSCYPNGGGGADWTVRDGMVRWLSARQAGIEQARAEVGERGVRVLGGAECNSTPAHEWPPGSGSQCGENVLPYIDPPPDLCGLSAYRGVDSTDMSADLAWLRERCNARRRTPPPFEGNNVYVAELGAAGNEVGDDAQLAIARAQITSALANGAQLAIYWQLYSNECTAGCPNVPVRDADVRGFWLVRPEPREAGGTPTPTYRWMEEVLAPNRTTASPPPPDARVRIVARASGRCLEGVERLEQRACERGRTEQRWRLDSGGDGRARLVHVATGRSLAARGDGVAIDDGDGAAWQLAGVPEAGAYFTLRDAASSLCLELAGGTYEDGPHLRLARCDGSRAQMFLLIEEPSGAAHDE